MPRAVVAILIFTSAVLGAALVIVLQALPPRAAALEPALPPTIVLGGYHIHSTRSDGSGSVDEIARAAHDAGLAFIILTDHGDGTAVPLAPAYRSGVLCIDAVEISTNGGHVVALGLNDASPFPMAGEPADVIDDIHRRGGAAFVAHPDSPKLELQWRAWNAPYDGLEWLNADSEWRERTPGHLTGLIPELVVRPPETIAWLFHRPTMTLRRWEGVLGRRPVVAVAGLDAHANLAGWPRYADMFRALAQAVVLDAPLSGDGADDARAVLTALRAGRTYSIVRGIASPAALDFTATTQGRTAGMGQRLPMGDTVHWFAAVPQSASARVALVEAGREVARGKGTVTYDGPGVPGAIHVEVTYPGSLMPWLLSNPIYVGPEPGPDFVRPEPAPATGANALDVLRSALWHVEHDAKSTGQIDDAGGTWDFHYALAPGAPAGQYAAAVAPTHSTSGVDRIQLEARADRPMRVSVQVRLSGPGGRSQRWRRSIYLDQQARTIVLPLSTFVAADRPTSQQPVVSVVQELLIVVDTVNTAPGSSGTIWLGAAAVGTVRPDGATSER